MTPYISMQPYNFHQTNRTNKSLQRAEVGESYYRLGGALAFCRQPALCRMIRAAIVRQRARARACAACESILSQLPSNNYSHFFLFHYLGHNYACTAHLQAPNYVRYVQRHPIKDSGQVRSRSRRSSARLQKGTHFSLDSFFRGMKFTKIPANQVNFFKKEECTISGENRRQSILLFLVLFLVKHFI